MRKGNKGIYQDAIRQTEGNFNGLMDEYFTTKDTSYIGVAVGRFGGEIAKLARSVEKEREHMHLPTYRHDELVRRAVERLEKYVAKTANPQKRFTADELLREAKRAMHIANNDLDDIHGQSE